MGNRSVRRGGTRERGSEIFRKDILGSLLESRGLLEFEKEIVNRLRADILFIPQPERDPDREDLGVLGRMIGLGACLIELYSRTPGVASGLSCVNKHLAMHGKRANQRNSKPGNESVPPTRLWIISPGQPRTFIRTLAMVPADDWPSGFWCMPGEVEAYLVVVRELPVVRETLFLRLLGNGRVLEQAIAELGALPARLQSRKALRQVILAWRGKIFETRREVTLEEEQSMLFPETRARYEEWKNMVSAGERKEGERSMLLKMLELKFGPLSPAAGRRVKRASSARLERWAEKLLTAETLDEVLDN